MFNASLFFGSVSAERSLLAVRTFSLCSLPDKLQLAIILAAKVPVEAKLQRTGSGAPYTSADLRSLRSFLLLCKSTSKLVTANWPLIVEHYTLKTKLPHLVQYTFCGRLHRDGDLPACIDGIGTQRWYQHGKLHRKKDLPAAVYSYGKLEWWQHGKLHRDNDLPSVINMYGGQEWHHNGLIHRDNGLPAAIWTDDKQQLCRQWYHNGKLVRRSSTPFSEC